MQFWRAAMLSSRGKTMALLYRVFRKQVMK
jgi:hypothetical protein